MIIDSDDDFENLGWSGNGTALNPYLLTQEEFEGESFLRISNTRSHFKIENCTFDVDNIAINLLNVTNANITQNSITTWEAGIDIGYCNLVAFLENTILGGYEGVSSWNSNNCTILNNTIASIRSAILLSDAMNTTVVGNRLASVEEEYTAVDIGGSFNNWDDGISLGNAWFDYQGTGVYPIPGSSNSVDNYPTKFNPTFSIDFEGPYILAPLGFMAIDFTDTIPTTWGFIATVTDPSGVDLVIITINGVEQEMIHQPTSENPDQYVYNHPNPTTMTYSYWANDSLGFSSETPEGFISLGVFPFGGPEPTDDLYIIAIVIIGFLGIVMIVSYWLMKKS
ncbi:MAG: NosD domain-containing protein [Candidatus Thorarchaeota archaeon]|jgi:hypothetical protein